MNKKIIVVVIIVILIIVGVILFLMNSSGPVVSQVPVSVATTTETVSISTVASASSSVPLMQSTGSLFSQYKYYSKAHEIYPTLAADTQKALGAFSYTKEDLGNNIYRFTLTNDAEGYKGQSVVVGPGQSVYFIEPSLGDDSASEDSITTDDFFVVVNAQGYILK